MAQQINLYSPILLAPRQRFAARTMARALGVLALGLALLSAAVTWQQRQVDLEQDRLAASQASERQQLTIALAQQQARTLSGPALEQELRQVQAAIGQREAQWQTLQAGRLPPGQQHSDLLDLLARTVPAQAWVTRLQAGPDVVSLSGSTTDPLAVRQWTEALARTPVLSGLQLASVTVERSGGGAEPATGTPPTWNFRIVSASSRSAAQLGQPGATR